MYHCYLYRPLQTYYCNSLYYKFPKSQLSRLQQIQNSLARTVVKAPTNCHITPILRSPHWLRIIERIEYKLLSLTYKFFTTTGTQPPYLHNLIYVQRPGSTCSSSVVILARPPSSSSLKITDNIIMIFFYLTDDKLHNQHQHPPHRAGHNRNNIQKG